MEEKQSSAHGIRWDLTDLYSGVDDPKINSDIQALKQRASSFESVYRDIVKPGITPGQLAEAVNVCVEVFAAEPLAAAPNVIACRA